MDINSSRGWHRVWASAALVVFAAVGALYVSQKDVEQPFIVTVDEELQLQFVGTNSVDSQPDFRSWQERLYERVPDRLKGKLLSKVWPQPRRSSTFTPVKQGSVQILFTPLLEEGKSAAGESVRETVKAKLAEQPIVLQLEYSNGKSHPFMADLLRGDKRGTEEFLYYGVAFEPVPKTVRNFKLLVMKDTEQVKREIIAETQLPNPIYEKILPLEDPVKLPASAGDGNVTVTLVQCLYNVKFGSEGYGYFGTKPKWVDGEFSKALETAGGTAQSIIVVKTTSSDNNADWGVEKASFSYGQRNIPYDPSEALSVTSFKTTDGLLQKFSTFTNLGVIQQPVKVRLKVGKLDGFDADKLHTVHIPLPATETSAGPVYVQLPDSKASVYVGNRSSIPGFIRARMSDSLTVLLAGVDEDVDVLDAWMVKADGTSTSLNKHRFRSTQKWYHDRVLHIDYHLGTIPQSERSSLLDISSSTTLSLTIVTPTQLEKEIEFTVTPTEPASTLK